MQIQTAARRSLPARRRIAASISPSDARRGAGASKPFNSFMSTVAGTRSTLPSRSITNSMRSPGFNLRCRRTSAGIVVCPLLLIVEVAIVLTPAANSYFATLHDREHCITRHQGLRHRFRLVAEPFKRAVPSPAGWERELLVCKNGKAAQKRAPSYAKVSGARRKQSVHGRRPRNALRKRSPAAPHPIP